MFFLLLNPNFIPCPQHHVTGTHLQPAKSSTNSGTLFFTFYFNIILTLTSLS